MDVYFFVPGSPFIRANPAPPPPVTITFTVPQDLLAGTVVTVTFTPPARNPATNG